MGRKDCLDVWRASGHYNEQSMKFLEAVLQVSGLGDSTFLPPGVQVHSTAVECVMLALRTDRCRLPP